MIRTIPASVPDSHLTFLLGPDNLTLPFLEGPRLAWVHRQLDLFDIDSRYTAEKGTQIYIECDNFVARMLVMAADTRSTPDTCFESRAPYESSPLFDLIRGLGPHTGDFFRQIDDGRRQQILNAEEKHIQQVQTSSDNLLTSMVEKFGTVLTLPQYWREEAARLLRAAEADPELHVPETRDYIRTHAHTLDACASTLERRLTRRSDT